MRSTTQRAQALRLRIKRRYRAALGHRQERRVAIGKKVIRTTCHECARPLHCFPPARLIDSPEWRCVNRACAQCALPAASHLNHGVTLPPLVAERHVHNTWNRT